MVTLFVWLQLRHAQLEPANAGCDLDDYPRLVRIADDARRMDRAGGGVLALGGSTAGVGVFCHRRRHGRDLAVAGAHRASPRLSTL
jgi:hypothetical protein